MTAEPVLATHTWRTNGHPIADVAKLGYLGDDDSLVLDTTYGRGNFWTVYRPKNLTAFDIRELPGIDHACDFRHLPIANNAIDVVVMDPPYRLNGTPDRGDFDERFGTHEQMNWVEKHMMIEAGIASCARVLKRGGHFLLKCQDQVCSGAIRWQTYEFRRAAMQRGLVLVDRFDMLGKARKQPAGRRQRHAYGRPSTLLVFTKP